MTHHSTESGVTDAALAWPVRLGYATLHAMTITPGEPVGKRADWAR